MRSLADLMFAELKIENKKSKWRRFKRKIRLLFTKKSKVYKKLKKLGEKND